MKRHRLLFHLISFLLALSIIGAVGCAEMLAAPNDEVGNGEAAQNENQIAPEGNQSSASSSAGEVNTPNDNGGNQQEQVYEEPAQEESPQQLEPNQWYDPIYIYDEDVTSAYEEPENLSKLPAASSSKVHAEEATSVTIPVVAVSDASLFSGIVMWLCVALGIAVVVGVLVSRRTRRNR